MFTKISTFIMQKFNFFYSIWVVVMCGVSILWIPVVERFQGGQMFLYIQAISSYLAPPICALYLLAILWKRVNEFVSIVRHYLMKRTAS